MCLEGLEEASGESSSESLKKSGRQFEAVGQGAVPDQPFLVLGWVFWDGMVCGISWSEGEKKKGVEKIEKY